MAFATANLFAQSNLHLQRSIKITGLSEGIFLSKFDVSSADDIYAISQTDNRLWKISSSGEVLDWIGGFGWENEQFDQPSNIWVTGLDVFVSDENNHRIQRYDKDLNFISTLTGVTEDSPPEFEYPSDVAQSNRGNMYISDPVNGHILKFSSDGDFLLKFGGRGYGEGTLTEPVSIAILSDESIIVADRALRAILQFDEFGNYIKDEGEELFEDPTSLASNENDEIFVLDSGNGSIYLFDSDMREYTNIDMDTGNNDLITPTDIATRDNYLYVLDSKNNTILIYK